MLLNNYRSSDGSITIHNDDPDLEARIQLCASILNLKPHYVWDWHHNNKSLVYTAVDWYAHQSLE